MRRACLAGAVLLAAFAISAAGAQAFVPEWEVKGPPTVYAPLALFTPETLHSTAAFGIIGGVGTGPTYKSSCEGADTETIENVGPAEGVDEMTAFEVGCNEGGDPYPCAISEPYKIQGASNASLPAWPSELSYPSNDTFEDVTVRVTCIPSGNSALYHPPGHIWNPKIGVNALKSSSASGWFRHGLNHFYFTGTDHLAAVLHVDVR
jgi:hypothetical protein